MSGPKPEFNEVVIDVLAAKGLRAADWRLIGQGSSDPYVIVRDVKGLVRSDQRTKTVSSNLNPTWNTRFQFKFNYKLSRFKLVVFDADTISDDDPLGKLVVPLSSFYALPADASGFRLLDDWFPLTTGSTDKWVHCRGKSLGTIHVRFSVNFNIPVAIPGMFIPVRCPNFQLGLAWDFGKHGKPVDLDASVVGLDDNWEVVDTVSFKKLSGFGGAVRHSGDDRTGDGGGDDETISIFCETLPTKVRYMFLVINSYTLQPLSTVKHAYVRVIEAHSGPHVGAPGMHPHSKPKTSTLTFFSMCGNMPSCTGLFFGLLVRGATEEFSFVTIAQPANGRVVAESIGACVVLARDQVATPPPAAGAFAPPSAAMPVAMALPVQRAASPFGAGPPVTGQPVGGQPFGAGPPLTGQLVGEPPVQPADVGRHLLAGSLGLSGAPA